MDALAVDQYQDIVVAQTVELHLRTHIVLAEGERGRQACKDILQTPSAIVLQHLAGDHLCLHRGILQQVLGAGTRHNDFLQTVLTPDTILGISADSQQPEANSQFLSTFHLIVLISATSVPERAFHLSMAGLLTPGVAPLPCLGRSSDFPQSALPSRPHGQWRYTSRPLKRGLQLQAQFRTLTGFPYIRRLQPPDCLNSATKIQLFLIDDAYFMDFF